MENRDLICYGQTDPLRKSADEMLKDLERKIRKRPKFGSFKISQPVRRVIVIVAVLTTLSVLFFFGSKQVSTAHVDNITIDKLWEYKTLAPVFATPAIADVNGDKVNDVIANSMDGKMYVIDGLTGKRIFFFETESPLLSSPVIMNRNNHEKWIILAGQDKKIYAISGNDHCQWSTIRQDLEAPVISTPLLASPGSGQSENVIVAALDGKIYSFNGDRGWKIWSSKETSGRFFATPQIAFINNDSTPDFIVGSPNHKVYGIDGRTGMKLWETTTEGAVNSSPLLLDSKTVVICDESGHIYKMNIETGIISETEDLKVAVIATPAVINRTINPVLIVPLKNGTIRALSAQTLKTIWEYDTKFQDPFVASPAICDLNADGCEDIVITSRNGYLYLLNGKDGKDLVPPYCTGNSISSSPVLGDLNGDGYLDIVFGSENGNITALTVRTVPDKIIKKNSIVYGTFLNRGHEKI